jgi:uncharacterized protein YjbI with pentapeptide repeats
MEDQPELHQKWQQIRKHPVASVLIALFFTLVVLVIFILGGYKFNWGWTGFNQPSKTLWDWLQLLGVLAVPVVVGFGAVWFTTRQGKVADAENTDNQREAVLQAYLDKMSELLLANHLRESAEDQEARQIARARTYTALSRLDGVRKRSALQFLYEAHLINIFDWSYADLSKAALSEATLSGANLSRAKLSGADLSLADLTDAKFTGADLSGADLTGADLTGADLSGADLTDTSLSGASLSGASLSGAYLGGANLSRIMHWHTVTTTQRQFYRNLRRESQRGSRLREQVLRVSEEWKNPLSIFLDESTMTVTFKNGTNLSGANLSGADLSGADLSDANLDGASLKKADLFTTNLTRANLKDANLTEAKMSRAKLTVVVRTQMFWNATSDTAYLEWADLEKGYTFPGEKGQILFPEEAKKLLEILEKSDGNKARLPERDFKTFTFRSKVVKLEAADLQRADLTGADLTDANLSRANLSYANLSRANLSYANLSRANLSEANLKDVTGITIEELEKQAKSLKGAIMPDGSIHP